MTIVKRIQPIKVLFDLVNNRRTSEPTSSTIYFDSVSEYECYLRLDRLFPSHGWDIKVHSKLKTSSCDWKIDFCISPKENSLEQWNQLTAIASIVNGCSFSHPLTHLWIEYKGQQDANFKKKMGLIKQNHPEIAKTIILCGNLDDAFGFFDANKLKFHSHHIISCYSLEVVIKSLF